MRCNGVGKKSCGLTAAIKSAVQNCLSQLSRLWRKVVPLRQCPTIKIGAGSKLIALTRLLTRASSNTQEGHRKTQLATIAATAGA